MDDWEEEIGLVSGINPGPQGHRTGQRTDFVFKEIVSNWESIIYFNYTYVAQLQLYWRDLERSYLAFLF